MSEAIQKLVNSVHQIEALNSQTDDIKEDIKEIYADLKSEGFDTKIVRLLIKIRAEDPDKLAEQESLLETYMNAVANASVNPTSTFDNSEYELVDEE